MTGPAQFGDPRVIKGIGWIMASSFFFTCMLLVIRELAHDLSIPQIVFLRSLVGAALFLPIQLLRGGVSEFRPVNPLMFGVRTLMLLGGTLTLFTGITMMPFPDAIALHFTVPLFTILAAVILLREKVSWQLWSATLVGFIGTLIILRPGIEEINIAAPIILVSAAFYALDNIVVKILGRTEPPVRIVFYMHALILPVALLIAVFDWRPLDWSMTPFILLLGILASCAHFSLARGYYHAKASVVSPISFIRLPISAAFAWLLYNETSDGWTWFGAVIIFAATTYIARREGRAPPQPINAGEDKE